MIRKAWNLAAVAAAVLALGGCRGCRGTESAAPPRIRSVFRSSIGLNGEYVLQVPPGLAAGERPGLMIFFHGDGQAKAGWQAAGTLHKLAKTGARFKLITVAMQEPHRKNWWQGKVAENVRYVDEFIENFLFRTLTIDQRHVIFTGISGGADFAGCIFPPQTRYKYRGAAVVTCGGDFPARMLAPPPVEMTGEMRRGFRYYFANVDDDPDFPPSLVARTSSYFQGLGFPVERIQASHRSFDGQRDFGSGHCSFDTYGWRDRFLESYFREEEAQR
jgi:poly(3-hydroxybutyrate) depolymerase